jgi:hypothetical protein
VAEGPVCSVRRVGPPAGAPGTSRWQTAQPDSQSVVDRLPRFSGRAPDGPRSGIRPAAGPPEVSIDPVQHQFQGERGDTGIVADAEASRQQSRPADCKLRRPGGAQSLWWLAAG